MTAPKGLALVTQKIFDSVRRKFVRASVGWSESNLADVSQKALSHKRFTSRDTSSTQATKSQLVDILQIKARQIVLTEEFDPGSE